MGRFTMKTTPRGREENLGNSSKERHENNKKHQKVTVRKLPTLNRDLFEYQILKGGRTARGDVS